MMQTDYDVFMKQELALELQLEADGQMAKVTAGNIEAVSLELHSYGFIGTLGFSGVDNEELDTLYASKKQMKVTLTFSSTDPLEEGVPLLELKGIVIKRFFSRTDTTQATNPYANRHYEVIFCDPAQATWSEHCPTQVYVQESMKDVIDAHKNPAISLKYDFKPLNQKHPIIAFSLGANPHIPHEDQDHFYSFLNWYLYKEGGILHYDYKTHQYAILGKKPPLSGEAYSIKEYWITPPTALCEPPPRANTQTLTHTADSLDKEQKEADTAHPSVRKDRIASDHYATFPEHAHETIHSLPPQHPELSFEVVKLESDFDVDKLVPGSYVSFFMSGKMETWSQDDFYQGKTFRSRALFLRAHKIGLTEKLEKPTQTYRLYIKALVEPKEETFIERPYFSPPLFPFTIQGKISSDVGEKEQSTYKLSESEKFPQGHYLVSVPLANHKNVIVPFTPDFMTGQYYFPLCKGERVLLSMYFHTAKIQRVIDWQPLARLPSGVQGNQIVLSSNGKDKYAIIRHEFEGGKDSVITIAQSTSATQTQTIQIKDKHLHIQVEEKDKLSLSIVLDEKEGVSVALEDKAKTQTQKIQFDGEKITTICEGPAGFSSCVQTPDSFTIVSPDVNVIAPLINLVASDKIVFRAPEFEVKAASIKLG